MSDAEIIQANAPEWIPVVRELFEEYAAQLGRRLGRTAIDFARAAGYKTACLDTLSGMTEALALYRGFGFRPTRAYCHNPLPDAVWMELELDRQDKQA